MTRNLFQFMRNAHHGPLFGEGRNHFYWAGWCDGVEAQVQGGEDHLPLLDFDLLKIHPQMVNHGMGYYERWFRRGYAMHWGHDAGSMEQIDKYRAQELAYGHAGFVGNQQTDNIHWVAREHHLMHAVQRLYGAACPAEIRYEVDGQWVTASAAVVAGDTVAAADPLHQRPDPLGELEGRALADRGTSSAAVGIPRRRAGNASGNGPARRLRCRLCRVPRVRLCRRADQFPGQRGCRRGRTLSHGWRPLRTWEATASACAIEWIVNDTLDDDFHCFVHGVNQGNGRPDGIVFQQDHDLPQPTSRWRTGTRISDGPYEFSVPATFDRYDLVIGLHKGRRVPLKGGDSSDDRVHIAQLKLERSGGKITAITAAPPPRPVKTASDDRADFSAHLNRPGTWVDFGPVATDGAVKINRAKDRLVLFPYPRNKAFHVSLDLKALAPAADPLRVAVRVLAAGDGRDLGPAEFRWEKQRLVIAMGHAGAGRFVIEW